MLRRSQLWDERNKIKILLRSKRIFKAVLTNRGSRRFFRPFRTVFRFWVFLSKVFSRIADSFSNVNQLFRLSAPAHHRRGYVDRHESIYQGADANMRQESDDFAA